ncbi:MAG: glutamate racemase [Ignavibacteriae bacterium]|nr:glutamate racemase [Ignavibacteriota bacterium]MCB9216889.1 glutamate racemase [Ignavibacteria bacterium]
MIEQNKPIGLFDSGVGGLTVAHHVMQILPLENTIYFGDSARVPYGSKSTETVQFYTKQAINFLERKAVKLIIIACNTASAVALEYASSIASVPVIGVIEPGARGAVEASTSGRIGVIGTQGTVRSEAYQNAITAFNPSAKVFAHPCPLLVGFAEEGLIDHPATELIAREYLEELLDHSIDSLIMGCTHYPILKPTLAKVAGTSVQLIDPGLETAKHVQQILAEKDLLKSAPSPASHEYYLSDFPHKFIEIGSRFLGSKMHRVEKISLESLSCE